MNDNKEVNSQCDVTECNDYSNDMKMLIDSCKNTECDIIEYKYRIADNTLRSKLEILEAQYDIEKYVAEKELEIAKKIRHRDMGNAVFEQQIKEWTEGVN